MNVLIAYIIPKEGAKDTNISTIWTNRHHHPSYTMKSINNKKEITRRAVSHQVASHLERSRIARLSRLHQLDARRRFVQDFQQGQTGEGSHAPVLYQLPVQVVPTLFEHVGLFGVQ